MSHESLGKGSHGNSIRPIRAFPRLGLYDRFCDCWVHVFWVAVKELNLSFHIMDI